MDKLKQVIEEIKKSHYVEGYNASDAEALGVAIANYFEWSIEPIGECVLSAMEDANMHTEARILSNALTGNKKDANIKPMKTYKETNLAEGMKVVIAQTDNIPFNVEEIDSVIGAIGYAAKSSLMLTESVTGEGQILGNVMLIDISLPLWSTNSRNLAKREGEFFQTCERYIKDGVLHKGEGITLGGLGGVTVNWTTINPVRVVTIKLETADENDTIKENLETLNLGKVLSIS